jgi:hypothetical protein
MVSAILGVVAAWAIPGVTVTRMSGYYDTTYGGGEFTIKSTPWANPVHYSPLTLVGGGFQSFCVEVTEYISSGQPYWAELSTEAKLGGAGGGSPDPLSIGTAWLYKLFAQGQLSGYDYTPGSGRAASARALQETIWWLEDEIAAMPSNSFSSMVVAQFGGAANAKVNYDPSTAGFSVRVINLYDLDGFGNPDYTKPKQDQLVYLPDGGLTMVLLGIGMLGVAALRRKG